MAVAIALGSRGRGRTAPNPNVGSVLVRQGRIVGRGWCQPGGRPHAEAMALAEAGEKSRGATCYSTLEPCAHDSARGPACADLLIAGGVARVVGGMVDPDPRTAGQGYARLRDGGIEIVDGVSAAGCARSIEGFLARSNFARPHVTLKLAVSLDGRIARADGTSRWITGAMARAHAHLERARAELIVVGRGTVKADTPGLDVRLEGLEDRSPRRAMLTRGDVRSGWERLAAPSDIARLDAVDHVLVEGGAGAAASFLAQDLVDRLLLYRAPILIGDGKAAIGDIGLADLADAHDRWHPLDTRMLGSDRLDVYERRRS